MKKNPKTPSLSLNVINDRKLACAALALCLMGGTAMTAQASGNRGGQASDSQQVATTSRITGTVLDENGDPMIGVSVIEEGTKTGVATDLDGNFSLNVHPGAVLHFSYIGYKSQSIKVGKTNSIEVTMQPDDNVLDDVVVIGFGTVKKRDLTGAISSVKSDVITLTPSSNPMSALQGRVAGLDITQTSGQPGEGLNIQLRGNRSITASGNPLFIIDGMPGNYSTINPNDIESIEVLKDASSTAVYGSEGSNGVIIITTKKGEEGKMRVNFDAYMGVNGWATTPEMNSPAQYIKTRELANKYSGSTIDDSNLDDYRNALAAGQTIDWVDEMLGTGLTQNYSLSMSGGTKATQAYFSLNYSDENGQYKNDNFKVYSSSVRVNTQLNDWLSGGLHIQASYTNRNTTSSHLDNALRAAPFGVLRNEDGSLNPYPILGNTNVPNLLLNQDQDAYRNNNNRLYLYVQPYVRITPLKGLTLESRMSLKYQNTNSNRYIGYNSYEYFTSSEQTSVSTNARITNSKTWGYTWENILTYNFKLADIHEFTLTGVTTWSSSQDDGSELYNTQIPSNTMYWTNMGKAEGLPTIGSSYSMHKRMGYVGRINYTLMGKYLFSASVRRDGDSVLASGRHWSTFPAFSLGWRISDENFMESTRSYLNNLKLRVGYGETGAAGIAPYSSYSIISTGQMSLGGQLTNTSFYPQIITNPALTWERSKSWNIGLDFGLFNNRIDLAAEYYITNTHDVIWEQSLPSNNGAFSATQMFKTNRNIASTRNQGFELTLTTHNIDTKDFKWSSTLTFSNNKEEVTSLGHNAAEYVQRGTGDKDYTLHIGDPVNSFYNYKFNGIWQSNEEADAAVFGLQPGDMKIYVPNMRRVSEGVWEKTIVNADGSVETRTYDANNKYQINANDKMIIGHNSPDWSLGFQNTFNYKWFDLSIYMYWRNGQTFYYEPIGWYDGHGGAFPAHFNYWTPDNPSNQFPALDANREWQNKTGNSAIYFVDGSFFKIKNITLGYTLPELACRKVGISKFRVYGTITNPLVSASSKLLKGYDPEMNGSFNFPLTRQLVFGLNVSF